MSEPVLLALIGSLAAIIIAVGGALRDRAAAKEAAKKTDIEFLRQALDQLQEENKRLMGRITILETKLSDRDAVIEKLTDRVRELETENLFLKAQIDELKNKRQRRQAE